MPDMLAIAQGLNAVKALTDITKTMIGLRDSAKILETSVELNRKIADVQIALNAALAEQTTLIQTIREREEEIARLKAWETEKERYELKNIDSGTFVYMIKRDAQGTEPLHCLCANCYARGEKGILQRTRRMSGPRQIWACPSCKNEVLVVRWPPREYPSADGPAPMI